MCCTPTESHRLSLSHLSSLTEIRLIVMFAGHAGRFPVANTHQSTHTNHREQDSRGRAGQAAGGFPVPITGQTGVTGQAGRFLPLAEVLIAKSCWYRRVTAAHTLPPAQVPAAPLLPPRVAVVAVQSNSRGLVQRSDGGLSQVPCDTQRASTCRLTFMRSRSDYRDLDGGRKDSRAQLTHGQVADQGKRLEEHPLACGDG